ncbi:MAG: PKD domain-containing protein [Bacteroidales bacterium]|nr:PKD domain-containing protein [Bacteroidales bacterium]
MSGNFMARISQWHWDFGDGTFAIFNAPTDPWHVYPTYGTYTVTLSVEDTNNCTYSISHPVEVRPHPTAFFTYSTPNCLGDASHFTELSTNPLNQGYIQQWVWNYGDGSPNDTVTFPSTANPTHTYANAGTYLVTLSIMNSRLCTDTYSTTITISRRALPDFSFWSNCQNQTAIFQDQTNLNGGGQVASWLWTFGDPTSGALNTSTLQNPTHIYSAAGTYNVLLWVTNFNGCADSISRDVVVKGAPDAEFINAPGCLTSPTLFWADSLLINVPPLQPTHGTSGMVLLPAAATPSIPTCCRNRYRYPYHYRYCRLLRFW